MEGQLICTVGTFRTTKTEGGGKMTLDISEQQIEQAWQLARVTGKNVLLKWETQDEDIYGQI